MSAAEDPALTSASEKILIFDGKPKKLVVVHNGNGPYKAGRFIDRIAQMPGGKAISVSDKLADKLDLVKTKYKSRWLPKEAYAPEDTVIYLIQSGVVWGRLTNAEGKEVKFPNKLDFTPEMQEAGLQLMREKIKILVDLNVDIVFLADTFFNKPELMTFDSHQGYYHARKLVAAHNATELGRSHPAIDTQTPTEPMHPLQLREDLYHPSHAGYETMAHTWLEALCKWDGIDVPTWSKEMMDSVVNDTRAAHAAVTEVSASEENIDGVPHLRINWVCDPKEVKSVSFNMSRGKGCLCGAVKLVKDVPVPESGKGTYTMKLTDMDLRRVKPKQRPHFWASPHRVMLIGHKGRRKDAPLRMSEEFFLKNPEADSETE